MAFVIVRAGQYLTGAILYRDGSVPMAQWGG